MYQTMEEIHEKFTKDWVFMINCERGEHGSLAGGEVVLHSERKKEVLREMEKYDYEPSLTYFGYVGKIPEDMHLWLSVMPCSQ